MAKKSLEIDMCAGSQLRDTQGEMLSIEGADISELVAGRGRLNDNHGKGFVNSIGRVTFAKKVFKAEDCDDDRQKYYWEKIKAPYIYVRGYLYDNEDHSNARAAAAILRNIHKADVPLKIKASVEGGVISRGISDPSLLARTKIHSVALTFTPANTATLVEPLNLDKSIQDVDADMELIKSVVHLVETNVPSFRHIVRDASASKIRNNIEQLVTMLQVDDLIDVPTKQEILTHALESKVRGNIEKIHEAVCSSNEELDKGFKSAALGAALAATTALSPTHIQSAPPLPTRVESKIEDLSRLPASHQEMYQRVARENPILGAIGWKESSGGTNYQHKPIRKPSSIHHGHTAGGMFGMMPNAARDILKHDPQLAAKYPKLTEAAADIKKNHKIFTDVFNSDPQAAIDFAESLVKRNKGKTKGLEMLFHSWNRGLKGTWRRYKDEGSTSIKQDPYVKETMSHYRNLTKKPLHKALTAGYGGAAVPTSRVGGAVLQSESLDDKLKFITCPHCGKEQVYHKFQVKCREPECGKSFPMDALHKFFMGSM